YAELLPEETRKVVDDYFLYAKAAEELDEAYLGRESRIHVAENVRKGVRIIEISRSLDDPVCLLQYKSALSKDQWNLLYQVHHEKRSPRQIADDQSGSNGAEVVRREYAEILLQILNANEDPRKDALTDWTSYEARLPLSFRHRSAELVAQGVGVEEFCQMRGEGFGASAVDRELYYYVQLFMKIDLYGRDSTLHNSLIRKLPEVQMDLLKRMVGGTVSIADAAAELPGAISVPDAQREYEEALRLFINLTTGAVSVGGARGAKPKEKSEVFSPEQVLPKFKLEEMENWRAHLNVLTSNQVGVAELAIDQGKDLATLSRTFGYTQTNARKLVQKVALELRWAAWLTDENSGSIWNEQVPHLATRHQAALDLYYREKYSAKEVGTQVYPAVSPLRARELIKEARTALAKLVYDGKAHKFEWEERLAEIQNPQYRQILLLLYKEAWTKAEIATALGISSASVRRYHDAAMSKLGLAGGATPLE
ncbi:MAG: hypothetical protein KDD70_12380, partial [Bdellovibrionales bacterium]|nr:hypothetical protein [Bdellovibrionales bacterium]